jgi:hypothetical protein
MGSKVGRIAVPAAAALAGYSDPGAANTMLGGADMVLQAEAAERQRQLQEQQAQAMQKAMQGAMQDPNPAATSASDATRTAADQGQMAGLRDVYQGAVSGRNWDLAYKAAAKMAELNKPTYGTVAPGHSTTMNGEILGQAPGVYDIKGDTQFHTTEGGMAPTQLGLGNLMLDEAETGSVIAKNEAGAAADLALRDKRLGELEKVAAQNPGDNGGMSAKELAAAISDVHQQMQKLIAIPRNEITETRRSQMMKLLRHEYMRLIGLGDAYDEANALDNNRDMSNPDSTQEGLTDPRIEVEQLEKYKMPTSPAAQPGGFTYDPSSGNLIAQ